MPKKSEGINIVKLAKEAGVSVATISRVMNRRTGVSESTRHRIEALLRQYDFKPDRDDPRPPRIGLLIPWNPTESYMQSIIAGAYEYATDNNIDINVVPERANGMPFMEHIRDLQCAGVIIVQHETLDSRLQPVLNSELPVVTIDCGFDFPGTGSIRHDAYSGVCAAMHHLIQLGHRNIGYMMAYLPEAYRKGPDGLPDIDRLKSDQKTIRRDNPQIVFARDHRQRYQGYLDTMRENGLKIKPEWVLPGLATDNDTSVGACGRVTMKQFLRQAPELTAILTVQDSFAMGAYTTLYEKGKKIPEDMSIIGFGNNHGCQNWFPPLTTIEHPVKRMGSLAVEAIDGALRNPSGWLPPRITIPAELLVRDSTRAI